MNLVAASFAKSEEWFIVFQDATAPCSQMSRLSTRLSRAFKVLGPQSTLDGTDGIANPYDDNASYKRLNSTCLLVIVHCLLDSATAIVYRVLLPGPVGKVNEVTVASISISLMSPAPNFSSMQPEIAPETPVTPLTAELSSDRPTDHTRAPRTKAK